MSFNDQFSLRKNSKKQVQGVASKCSSRIAKSGSFAHGFFIGKARYTIFCENELSPVTDGDHICFEYETRRLKSRYHNKYNTVVPESLRIQVPVELEGQVNGQVYILSNQSMPGILKIGYTTGLATKRAHQLSSTTGVPTGFRVEWSLPVLGNPRAVEQSAHAHLAKYRYGKEFFKVSLEAAKAACIQSFAKIYPELASTMDGAFAARAKVEHERRDELEKVALAREVARQKETSRQTFLASREGRWATKGKCLFVLKDFQNEPHKGSPTFFAKLIGRKFEDFLECRITLDQRDDALVWAIDISGRQCEMPVWRRQTFVTRQDCVDYLKNIETEYGIMNCRATIEMPNRLIENPPSLPKEYYNPEATLAIETIDNLIFRPMSVQEDESKRLYRR